MKIFFFLIFWLLSTSVCAVNVFDHPVHDAHAILKRVKIYPALTGDFAQSKYVPDADITLRSRGTFALDEKRGIRWSTTRPFISDMVMLDDKMCLKNGGKTQVMNLTDMQSARQVMDVIRSILVQDYDRLTPYFSLYFIADDDRFHIGLKTIDPVVGSVFSSMEIRGKKYVDEVTLKNKNGDVTVISFSSVKQEKKDFDCE